MNNGDLLPHPDQPIYLDVDDAPRFKRNAIVRFLQRRGGYEFDTLHDMNFSTEDWAQFMQLLGYSVCGYGELSFIPSDKIEHADAEAERRKQEVCSHRNKTSTGSATNQAVDHYHCPDCDKRWTED